MTSTRRSLIAATLIVLTIVSDWLTKEWALSALGDGERIALLPTLEFDLLYNNGFSFGTGQGQGRLIGVGVIIMVVYLAFQLVRSTVLHRVIFFSIILGGAIGNLIDRIFRADDGFLSGSVIDFIDVSWFAVFNLADIYVVCGAIAFALWETVINPAVDPTDDAPTDRPESDRAESDQHDAEDEPLPRVGGHKPD